MEADRAPALDFDENTARRLEAIYDTADVLRRRRLVGEALAAKPGERVLDVGCGPGFYLAELREQIGPDGWVDGVDASRPMLALAARRNAEWPNVGFHVGAAEALPVDSAAYDGLICVQVLEYVQDVPGALAEMHRVLRPGGRLVIWDVDWATVSWHSADPGRCTRVLRAWDEHLVHPSLPRILGARLGTAGFIDVAVTGHPFVARRLDRDHYAGALLPLIESFVADRAGVSAAEAQEWAVEQRELDGRGEFFFACLQFCVQARKPGPS
jgi:ubiquinone/menaquinone biosynthesis C-methylase UbiE